MLSFFISIYRNPSSSAYRLNSSPKLSDVRRIWLRIFRKKLCLLSTRKILRRMYYSSIRIVKWYSMPRLSGGGGTW